jgi:hypothetical protein
LTWRQEAAYVSDRSFSDEAATSTVGHADGETTRGPSELRQEGGPDLSATTLISELDTPMTLSADDIAQYREKGWVSLRSVIPRQLALFLRDRFLQLSDDAKAVEIEVFDPQKQNYTKDPAYRAQHVIHRENTLADEFTAVTRSARMASIISQLIDAPEVQLFRTSLFEKVPQAAGGSTTTLHQDYPYIPVDRSGSATIWIALGDLPEEMGTLRFVEGSHRLGSLGRDRTFRTDYDRITELAERDSWSTTPGLTLQAGDATVHHDLTVHGADPNRSDTTRLGLATLYMDARCLYNGAPSELTDGLGLRLNDRFDTGLFPVLPRI